MDKPIQASDSKHHQEKKYIRLMEAGLAMWLAMPFSLMLLAALDLWAFGPIIITLFVLAGTGYLCLEEGYKKRKELNQGGDQDGNSD